MSSEARPERAPEIDQPRIYAASLTDYNNGVLHGVWLNADQTADELHAGIASMLAASPTTRRYGDVAEEWAIHDYEGFGPVELSEWERIDHVAALGRGIAAHGVSFAAWWGYAEPPQEDCGDVEAQYQQQFLGEFDYLTDYGEQLLEDIGFDLDQLDVPASLRPYLSFDTAAWIRDVEIEGGIESFESPRGVYVFQPTD